MLLLFLFPERLLEVQNSISDSSWHILGVGEKLGISVWICKPRENPQLGYATVKQRFTTWCSRHYS